MTFSARLALSRSLCNTAPEPLKFGFSEPEPNLKNLVELKRKMINVLNKSAQSPQCSTRFFDKL